MKKILLAFLLTSLVFFTLVFSLGSISNHQESTFKVAMVTDFADVNDESFNQACYEGGKEWARKNDIIFNYYKPSDISKAERIKSMNLAIDRGYNVILCPGYAHGEVIAEIAPKHPEVTFIGIDISEGDFPQGFDVLAHKNIAIYNYHEEIAGYLAGYAVVKDGYRKLGYLGGIPAAPVIRYGYGYVQGIDAAALELNVDVSVEYVYGGQFFGDSEIFKYIDNWYKGNKTDIIFSCGGSIYTSVALAAKENGGHLIGVDNDQAPIIDENYGKDICVTSAMKGIKQTVIAKLDELYKTQKVESGFNNLGLVSSEHPELNYVQLATDHWRMNNFTIEEYKELISEIMLGYRPISGNVLEPPLVSEHTTVNYRGSIK